MTPNPADLRTTVDERPKFANMRRRELLKIALKQPHIAAMFATPGNTLEDKTKDELLTILGFQSHFPKTHPLGTNPADAPYQYWSDDQIKLELRKRRRKFGNFAKRDALIKQLEDDDRSLMKALQDDAPPADEPMVDVEPEAEEPEAA